MSPLRAVLRALPAAPVLAVVLAAATPAEAAPVWSQTPSGTTEDITAIEYQADDRLWFTTANGKIFRREGTTFVQRLSAPGVVFNDIEMRGSVGLAVGNGGTVYRSADAGMTWARITMPPSNDTFCFQALAFGDARKVAFATDAIVYVFGARAQVMRSANGGASWVNYNPDPRSQTCKIEDPSASVAGAFFVPGATTPTAYLLAGREVLFSSDDLASAQSKSSGLDFFGPTRLAGDPANPNRQWGVEASGVTGSANLSRTEDGWTTNLGWEIANPARRGRAAAADVAYSGGTVLAAGTDGVVLNSIDGRRFFYVGADGPMASQEWRTVGLASAARAAIGGAGGMLAMSTNVNTTPDIVVPTGQIDGPSAVTVGTPATFTAQLADEAGGSGIDPASVIWTVPGLPTQSGPSATFTFPNPGVSRITLAFRDRAGNMTEVSRNVEVNAAATTAPKPTEPAPKPKAPGRRTATQTFAGGTITFSFPGTCVAPGSSFTVRLAFKRSTRKGNVFVKVSSTRFFAQEKSVSLDRKAPFAAVIKVVKARSGTTYRLRARATLKVKTGKPRARSIRATVKVC
ncbi:MAG: PKD domain-containing protein [Solirubrobacteraceae bacterium]